MQLGCLSSERPRSISFRTVTVAALALIAATAVASCGSAGSSAASSTTTTVGAAEQTATQWLCRPGQAKDPCVASLAATLVPASGPRTLQSGQDAPGSKFDCFYVYPTVSTEHSDNANLTVQPAEVAAAMSQASRFSQVCRVWAPMYRQRTAGSLAKGLGADPHADAVAYDSVLSAWKDYLAHDNHGRPVIFIGHSQGAAMLIRLLASQVDPSSGLRSRTVVAILAGGNVTVPAGKTVGATFDHLPLCTASDQTACVIAYSSFPSQPPADSNFGRPGQGVSLQSGQTQTQGVDVACVNPASIGGGSATLDPYFPTAASTPPPPPVTTPWVTYPDLYSGSCEQAGGATWLQVGTTTVGGRPVVTQSLGPTWGYHADDINLTLGNLINDVRAEEAAYASRH